MGNPAFPEDTYQSWVVDVVESCFDVEKEGEHLQARSLQGSHVVHEGEAGIIGAQPREGAAVVGVTRKRVYLVCQGPHRLPLLAKPGGILGTPAGRGVGGGSQG